MQKIVMGYLIVVNVIAFLLYGLDKYKAKTNRWRIKEAVLIGIAAMGGGGGALVGMYLFHHKTRKSKFYITIPLFVILYLILLGYLFL